MNRKITTIVISAAAFAAVAVAGCGGASSSPSASGTPAKDQPSSSAPGSSAQPTSSATPKLDQPSSSAPVTSQSSPATTGLGWICGVLTNAQKSAILGQPVAGSSAFASGQAGPDCTFGAEPVGSKFKIVAGVEEERGSASAEAAAWTGFGQYGAPVPGDSDPVWTQKAGTNTDLGVRLKNGWVLSIDAAANGVTGNVVPGSPQALLAVMNAMYNNS